MTDKRLSAKALGSSSDSGQHYATYFEYIPDDVAYEDLFHPAYWHHHAAGNGRAHGEENVEHAVSAPTADNGQRLELGGVVMPISRME